MEQEAVYFEENDIIKSAFHKNKRPISINKVDVEEIVSMDKDIKVMLFNHHCVKSFLK